jgi:hypothetical protein
LADEKEWTQCRTLCTFNSCSVKAIIFWTVESYHVWCVLLHVYFSILWNTGDGSIYIILVNTCPCITTYYNKNV